MFQKRKPLGRLSDTPIPVDRQSFLRALRFHGERCRDGSEARAARRVPGQRDGAPRRADPHTHKKFTMSLEPDLEAQAFPAAVSLVSALTPFQTEVLYFQDAFTGTRPVPTVVLFGLLNALFYYIQKMHLSLYSLLALLVLLATVHIDYYIFLFHAFCNWFHRPAGFAPSPAYDATLPVDALAARGGVLYCCALQLGRAIGNSLALFSFVNVGLITVILSACFYWTFLLGDRTVTWVLVNALFLVPLVVTRKIGFRGLHYPEALEAQVLARLRAHLDAQRAEAEARRAQAEAEARRAPLPDEEEEEPVAM
jgi:hypothetical protein